MSEIQGEGSSATTNTRREFLKKGAVAGGVAVGLTAGIQREIEVQREGLTTDHGVFFPLYERHDQGIR